jgi:ABC-2 type transport system ATP-binding protein
MIFMPIISVQEISKSYGKKKVLDKVSFDIEKGEIFGLLGSNGAGKSTITSIILGLEKKSSGKIIYFDDEKVNLKSKITLVPQDVAFYNDFTVEKNMMFFGSVSGLKQELIKKRVDFLIDWLSLTNFRKTKASFLSGGYQRLLNIAISLIGDPEIIFLDEPTVGLDPKMRQMLWDKFFELKNSGKTLILTTHYMDEAENLCTRIALLKNGLLLKIGKPQEMIQKYGGIKVMVLKIENGLAEKDLNNIKMILKHTGLVTKDEVLFIPIEQEHGLEKTIAIIQWLINKGYNITSSTTKEPDLEDVFLNLTDEKFAERVIK